ncbi:MAG: aldo/keto reductase [Planctomycetota bacterium]|jgi:aryl-alcohol dehydrogenase-like predicted oxidoreductase
MVLRPLDRTGLLVSPIGFGAFKIGRNVGAKYEQSYDLPDEEAVSRLLNGVLDLGINLIDTAPAYGLSEERVGRALAHRRHEFVLSTKVGETFEDGCSTHDFSAAAIQASLERSLHRLRTDALDVALVHSPGDDLRVLEQTDVVEALRDAKSEGLVRAIGLSGKTVAGAEHALTWADVLMVEYHLEDRSHEEVIERAAASSVGVIVKKGLASGRLPADEAVRFVLGQAGVSSLVVGSLDLDHLRANVAAAEQAGT